MKKKLSILGVGYVGLPLAIEFSKFYNVVGYDQNKYKINNLKLGKDSNQQYKRYKILKSKIKFTSDPNDLIGSSFFIVCVPTPINHKKLPNLSYLRKACISIGKILKKNDTIIFESTVYPGCTEEFCLPIIEKCSKLKVNKDFICGYSPERINPGDKKNKLSNIVKIISSSSIKGLKIVKNLYQKIIKAGLHETKSIKIAEAAKILENIQRSVNISLINEASLIFRKLKINTHEVLEAASTKWNFIKFKPGLVGGHCIAVDPYYLTYKAKQIGINPKLILAGQNINNHIPIHIANRVAKKINLNTKNQKRVILLGLTFKEDSSDIRDIKVFDINKHIKKKGGKCDVFDPWVNKNELMKINLNIIKKIEKKKYDAIILAVSHSIFKKIGFKKFNAAMKKNGFFYDVKSLFVNEKNVECL
jgi:UDP-N-acetyl-D-galactosamine dehydrogenase